MNEIIKKLEIIKQDLYSLETEYADKLEAVHQEYRARLEVTTKRYESYCLVAEEQGWLDASSFATPVLDQEIDKPAPQIEEGGQESEKDQIEANNESRHPAQKHPLTIGDAVEKLLKEAGIALGVNELRKRAKSFGIDPSSSTFRSAISKDRQKRFERVSIGVYKLRNSNNKPVELPENSLFNSQIVDVKSNGHNRKNYGFVLVEQVRKIVAELDGREFTPVEVFEKLQEQFPDKIDKSSFKSIYSTVNNLRIKNELVKIRDGKDGEPAIYKAKSEIA